jgi:hypothetical protein
MTPVRHEDDFRRKPIKDWDSYIEDAITEAQARGEFDNLPGAGKPIRIHTNPLAPELDFAFSRLRNAGYKPTWMELDEEIKAGQEALQKFLQDSVSYVVHQADRIRSGTVPIAAPKPQPSFWKRFLHGAPPPVTSTDGPETLHDLRDIVDRMRIQYLEKSTQLDKRIGEFNGSLGRNLWHLERMRLTRERAIQKFATAFAEIDLNQ